MSAMRWLAFVLLASCNGSSGSDGGVDGSAMDVSSEANVDDGGAEGAAQDGGATTCAIPKGGAMCNGLVWQCDETDDCVAGQACCLTLDMTKVGGSFCSGFCNNPKLQLCTQSSECTGGAICVTTSCSGYVVKTCGGVPANLCK
jgi:hypothetical protein